jgi:hypothetical protein
MNKPYFISVNVIKSDGTTQQRFINSDHIIQVYEENGSIFLELTEYTIYKIETTNIHVFMDRFSQANIYNKHKG